MSSVDRYFSGSVNLPVMPEVASLLIRTFGDDNASLDDLAQVLRKDPALVAKVLRLANSARYSPAHNVANLNDAAATLGTVTLRNLALSACMAGAFPSLPGMDLKRFWKHGLACAHYAVLLSRAALLDTEIAYLAGLMLRTGQVLMLQVDAKTVQEIEGLITEPGARFGWEQTRLGCTHSDVTAELARRWKFPTPLVYGFQCAAEPLAAKPFSALGAVLHLSEVLADALDQGIPGHEALSKAEPDLVAHEHVDLAWLSEHLLDPAALAQETELLVSR
ncbi:MAG: HDOD domain-containing protein [Rhizobacter sp.]